MRRDSVETSVRAWPNELATKRFVKHLGAACAATAVTIAMLVAARAESVSTPQAGPAPQLATDTAAPACANVPAARDWGFMIFFDKDSDQIPLRQQKTIGEIGKLFISHHVSSLDLLGYADVGEEHDRHLGARRAQSIRSSLVKAGIQPDIIVIHDLGARHPLVPTPPDVPEPQNRRVELRPALHSSDEELPRKRECEEWLRVQGSPHDLFETAR